jgi:diguanylate cyclase (GGDEF)-like protein
MFDEQAAILPKLFERRQEELIFALRHERKVIASQMAAKNMLQSGAFNVAVAKAFVEKYEEFAHKLIAETFDLLRRSGVQIDSESAKWMSDKVGHYLEVGARNVLGEGNGGKAPTDELRQSVERAIDASLGRMRRDLQIDLDLTRATKTATASVEVVAEASLDPLVGLQNRRGLDQAFAALMQTRDEPACVVLFDIDQFKDVNDKHGGHAVGDEALKAIADIAAACVRHKGQAFRFGGDEFVLLLPNHTRDEGLAVAERLRREVNGAPRTSKNLTLSVSVGLAVWPSDGATLDDVRNAADKAMYDAKQRRRNLVRYYGETDAPPHQPTPHTERKLPDPNALTAKQQLKIRQDYFRTGIARCPRDQAILEVEDMTSFGNSTRVIMVNCPLCGLNEELS